MLEKFCIWGKALETSTNRNIILHPAKITSVLLPPPFAWHGIPIIQIPIKTSTEISGNCGEGKYAGAESPFVLHAQQTGWRDRKSVNNISKRKKKLLPWSYRTFQHHWRFAVCTFSFQNAALWFLLIAYNSTGKEFLPCGGLKVHVTELNIYYNTKLCLHWTVTVCFWKAKKVQKFKVQGNVRRKGHGELKSGSNTVLFHLTGQNCPQVASSTNN